MRWTEAEYQAYTQRQTSAPRQRDHAPKLQALFPRKIVPYTPFSYKSQLEADYADLLTLRMAAGEIAAWMYEPVRLDLAVRTTFTPDFLLCIHGDIIFDEVKGKRRWEDAMVKLKMAATLYPWWTFRLVERDAGGWRYTLIPPRIAP